MCFTNIEVIPMTKNWKNIQNNYSMSHICAQLIPFYLQNPSTSCIKKCNHLYIYIIYSIFFPKATIWGFRPLLHSPFSFSSQKLAGCLKGQWSTMHPIPPVGVVGWLFFPDEPTTGPTGKLFWFLEYPKHQTLLSMVQNLSTKIQVKSNNDPGFLSGFLTIACPYNRFIRGWHASVVSNHPEPFALHPIKVPSCKSSTCWWTTRLWHQKIARQQRLRRRQNWKEFLTANMACVGSF